MTKMENDQNESLWLIYLGIIIQAPKESRPELKAAVDQYMSYCPPRIQPIITAILDHDGVDFKKKVLDCIGVNMGDKNLQQAILDEIGVEARKQRCDHMAFRVRHIQHNNSPNQYAAELRSLADELAGT